MSNKTVSDFELLKHLQNEMLELLAERKLKAAWIPRNLSKARLHRLRLEIQEVMLRIERKCESCYKTGKEAWE